MIAAPAGAVAALLQGGDYGKDVTTLCHRSSYGPGLWRATRIDKDGDPFGHCDYSTLEAAVREETKWGAKLVRWYLESELRVSFMGSCSQRTTAESGDIG